MLSDREEEDDGHAREKDVQRDLVRRFLPFGAFHQGDHPVEEGRALIRGDAHHDPVGDHKRAAGHGARGRRPTRGSRAPTRP